MSSGGYLLSRALLTGRISRLANIALYSLCLRPVAPTQGYTRLIEVLGGDNYTGAEVLRNEQMLCTGTQKACALDELPNPLPHRRAANTESSCRLSMFL